MSNYSLISALRDAATECEIINQDDLITLLLDAADTLESTTEELSKMTYLYKETSRHCERYYVELEGLVLSVNSEPWLMGKRPTVETVSSEIRMRLEKARNAQSNSRV